MEASQPIVTHVAETVPSPIEPSLIAAATTEALEAIAAVSRQITAITPELERGQFECQRVLDESPRINIGAAAYFREEHQAELTLVQQIAAREQGAARAAENEANSLLQELSIVPQVADAREQLQDQECRALVAAMSSKRRDDFALELSEGKHPAVLIAIARAPIEDELVIEARAIYARTSHRAKRATFQARIEFARSNQSAAKALLEATAATRRVVDLYIAAAARHAAAERADATGRTTVTHLGAGLPPTPIDRPSPSVGGITVTRPDSTVTITRSA